MPNDLFGLPDYESVSAVWIEITKASHEHGGVGWEFGTCLWSPIADQAGAKRYELMREFEPGDVVIHWLVQGAWLEVATTS